MPPTLTPSYYSLACVQVWQRNFAVAGHATRRGVLLRVPAAPAAGLGSKSGLLPLQKGDLWRLEGTDGPQIRGGWKGWASDPSVRKLGRAAFGVDYVGQSGWTTAIPVSNSIPTYLHIS